MHCSWVVLSSQEWPQMVDDQWFPYFCFLVWETIWEEVPIPFGVRATGASQSLLHLGMPCA